ncbi:MAG: nuclear transport factor 2 family protein [Pseudomonadota bacterium]
MIEDEKRGLVERFLAAYNAFDLDGMMALTHPDIEFRNISGGKVTAAALGAEEFRRLAEQSLGLFASRRQSILTYRGKDEQAFLEIAFEAVPARDLPNGMKAGETIRLNGVSEFTFRDGKILRLVDIS